MTSSKNQKIKKSEKSMTSSKNQEIDDVIKNQEIGF